MSDDHNDWLNKREWSTDDDDDDDDEDVDYDDDDVDNFENDNDGYCKDYCNDN